MGGPWGYPTDCPLIRVQDWSRMIAVSYGEADWASRSYRLFVFEAE